ncbi:hypothetical protein [Promicromonospora sp. NPDC019610]|uniref:hypothetical protein n=1 Tax=Promicromonospora sp. NPDC019610 TaxID=3364405 RepID=UPI003792EA79
MSAARVGEWHLLDYDDDPVPAEASGLDAVIKHYKDIAEMMTTQAALLKKIGDGDETLLKGEAADAMRGRAGESHEHLAAAAGRYDDVRAALEAYRPELETARSETGKALAKAEDAAAAQKGAEGLPDPVNADRPDDAPPLTEQEKQESQNRSNKIEGAKGELAAAKAIAVAAMSALDSAAERAAAKIKENWGDDGLKHSGWEAFVHGFNKFLKGLVEILGYIGMALAVLAILLPGVGALALAGLIVGVVSLVASIVLAAQGEASWMGVILGVIGVAAAGVGMVVAKSITASVKAAQGAVLAGKGGSSTFIGTLGGFIIKPMQLQKISIMITNKLPGWASIVSPIKSWSLSGALGLGGLKELSLLGLWGAKFTIKPWIYVAGPGAMLSGLISGLWGAVPPTSFPGEDRRGDWTGETDYEYNHLTT